METKELFANGYAIPTAYPGEYTFRHGLGRERREITLPVGVVPITYIGDYFCAKWADVLAAQKRGLAL